MLSDESLADLIRHRLDRARHALEEANAIVQMQYWGLCMNRLYYACFYAVSALLLTKGRTAKTHNGIRTLFFQEFVQTNILSPELGTFYSRIFNRRQESDYDDFIEIDPADVPQWIEQATAFVEEVETLTLRHL